VNEGQQKTVQSYVEIGLAEGARLVAGGEIPSDAKLKHGWFYKPTIFVDVKPTFRIAQEEIFGPVLSVLTFRTPEEAVEKANNTPYGLSAGVWTDKGSRILWMAERLRAGVVWANTYNRFDPASPFGGYKESGFGREGGLHGLEPYLEFE
jgi:aldehyde dehydrogenase (NAD+)